MTNRTEPTRQTRAALLLTVGLFGWLAGVVPANALNLAQAPLNLIASQPPLVMMTMARDHKLYYEAYNDYSDLDSDGTLDTYYKPTIEYYGYFDSYKCYDYTSGIFTPVSVTADKKCTGANGTYWSGDFLNYLTTARIDALRKVFYGGKRSTDTTTKTVLERTFVPQEAHSWGKEYQSVARDGYDIQDYTPLALPVTGTRHLFANTTLSSDANPPLLRVLSDSIYRIWEWVSIEKPVAGDRCLNGGNGPICTGDWLIIPASTTNGLSALTRTTYKTVISGAPANVPGTLSEFNTLESTYGIDNRKCGSDSPSTIDGSGNPFVPGDHRCSDDDFMTIFSGKLNIATAGDYTFGIDGDDAVDLFIDGTERVDWYGGHGETGSPPTHRVTLTLAAGQHDLKFRHHETTGGDSYHLYWQPRVVSTMTDYNVRVEVCKTITGVDGAHNEGRESNCQGYGSSPVIYKPTGLLHKYGQLDGMYFGLLTGSYDQNTNGGVLRKEVSSITNEIETNTGIFKESGSTCGLSGGAACVEGIVGTINRFKITSYSYSGQKYTCGWIVNRAMNDGDCEMWGNPLGEMVYEGLRYFAGKTSATASFVTSSTRDDALGLPKVTWGDSTNPYREGSKFPTCAKPYFMLVSDVYPSFDSDSIPGTDRNFGTFAGDISAPDGTALSASDLGSNMWNLQFGSNAAKNIFIGQVGATVDNAPTVKPASSFGDIRGLSPSDPTRQGGYSTSLMAFYGKTHDLSAAAGGQTTSTYSIALAPPLPQIEIKVGTNKVVLVPFAKSVGGSADGGTISPTATFQPTNQIVDFYVDTINNTTTGNTDSNVNGGRPYYKFRINYEDVEQGADHDMDAIATYEIKLNTNDTVTVSLSSDYAAGSIIQHMGYVISGTTADGVYLEVRDKDTDAGSDPNYFLDTPNIASALPLSATRTFTASSSASVGTILNDPLWYAAKFGGFNDANNDNIPNDAVTEVVGGVTVVKALSEWDADGDGVPDNYYLVVNPLKMLAQMDKALAKIQDDSGTLAMQTSSTRSFSSDTLLFQPAYNSAGWSGELNAYSVTKDSMSAAVWQAQQTLVTKTGSTRVILTYDVDKTSNRGIPFVWNDMTSTGLASLRTSLNKSANGTVDSLGPDRVTYLRGDVVTGMRTRPTNKGVTTINKLGDIVNSQPQYVPAPNLGYSDTGYAAFRTATAQASRTKMVYVGANDGMLHGFNATSGEELLAYVPSEMYRTRGTKQPLSKLTQTDYGQSGNPHRYYVDGTPTMGDICTGSPCAADGSDWKTILVGGLNGGGQGIYALDITDPSSFDETSASAAKIVKWEFLDHDHDGDITSATVSGDAELGYTYSRPFIVKLCTARDTGSTSTPQTCTASHWYVMFGNGYNNNEVDGYAGTGDAVLYVLDADTGFLAKKIALNQANGTDPNGLSELAPIDMDGDGTVDYVYAGDLKGNLWRMDFVSDSKASWGPTLGTTTNPDPLYIAFDEQTPTHQRQPITTAPDVISHPVKGTLVVFGTGRYVDTGDNSTTQAQTLYGIWDKFDNTTVASADRSNLQAQTVTTTSVKANTTTVSGGTTTIVSHDYRTVSENTPNWNSVNGWYVNFPDRGERIIYNPVVRGGAVLSLTTAVPSSDICKEGGDHWDYYLNVLTGGRLTWSVFVDLPGMQNFGFQAFASARKSSGISPSPTGIGSGKGLETRFGDKDIYKTNLGAAGSGRIAWREILND